MSRLQVRPDQRLVPAQVPTDVLALVEDALRNGSTVILDDAYPGGVRGVDYSVLLSALGTNAQPLVLLEDQAWEIPVSSGRLILLQDYLQATGGPVSGDLGVNWNPYGWRVEMRQAACSNCGREARLFTCRRRGY